MQSFFHSISAVLVILLMAGTGYFLGHIGYIRAEHKAMLTKLVVNVGLPCMCISSLTESFTRATLAEAGTLLMVSFLAQLANLLVNSLAARLLHIPHRRRGVFLAMGSFSNSVFIGMPMCLELFGEAAAPYVMCYYLVNTTMFQIFGIASIERSGQPEGHKVGFAKRLGGLLKKPPLISILVSLGLILGGVSLPGVLQSYTKYIGNIVSPLGLIYTGFILYEQGLKNLRLERGLPSMLALRFVAAPALCMLFCALVGVDGLARGVLLVESALPTMTQTVVLSSMLGADEDYAALGAGLSTLVSFGVIPLVMLLV